MSIFESIKHAIFGDHGPLGAFNHAAPTATPGQANTAPHAPASAPPAAPRPIGSAPPTAASPTPGAPQPAAAAQPVDVDAILAQKAQGAGQHLDWQHSIVDLMKLLGLDSSLSAREQLATELNYTGAKDGSAAMNIWLHKAVMDKLAADGGKVPADLAHA